MFDPLSYFRSRRALLDVIAQQNAANDELHRQLCGLSGVEAEAARWKAACDALEFNLARASAKADDFCRKAVERECKLAEFRAIVEQCRKERDAADMRASEWGEENTALSNRVEELTAQLKALRSAYDGFLAFVRDGLGRAAVERCRKERDKAVDERDVLVKERDGWRDNFFRMSSCVRAVRLAYDGLKADLRGVLDEAPDSAVLMTEAHDDAEIPEA